MDACGGGSDSGFQHGGDSSLNRASSGVNANPTSEEVSATVKCSMPVSRPPNVADSFFSTGWDQLVSIGQNEGHFGSSSLVCHAEFSNSQYPLLENHGGQFPYPSDPSYAGLIPRLLPCFGSGNFSEIVGSFGMPDYPQIANSGCQPNFISSGDGRSRGKTLAKGPQTQECRNSEGQKMGSTPSGRRRKRSPNSNPTHDQQESNAGELQKDPLLDASEAQKERDEKKLKPEVTEDRNSRGKQAKDNSNSGEAPKENYIHVRARRGQATNSHSLAERVRREKISERMRMLQELVPGCNKITGKAVMLDEIINYVQSLQQQVEFLSMKLATLIPELGSDLERIVSKDALHLHGGSATALGLGPGVGCSHPYASGALQGNLPVVSTAPYPHVPQASLDSDLQTLFHMGFESTSTTNILGPNGRLKREP